MDEVDRIVQTAIRKSVVTAPSDPNGGAKLPERQAGQPGRKRRDKENYMAIFDREAQESDDQLDEWEEDTNDTTDSPDRFVNDRDDTPEDADDEEHRCTTAGAIRYPAAPSKSARRGRHHRTEHHGRVSPVVLVCPLGCPVVTGCPVRRPAAASSWGMVLTGTLLR